MFASLAFVCIFGLAAGSTIPPAPCICTMEYMPVCGVDGQTYSNRCSMNCAGVAEDRPGSCDSPVCACPRIYRPVCGQDGKTYANDCELRCAGVALFQEGPCHGTLNTIAPAPAARAQFPCICTFIYRPVCGSDLHTYGNECSLECDAAQSNGTLTKLHDGPCIGDETGPIILP